MFAKIFVREIDFCYWIKKKVWFELGERYALAKEEKNYIFVYKVAVRSHYPFLKLAVEKIFIPRAASIWIENLLIQKHTSWEKGASCKSTPKNSTLQ